MVKHINSKELKEALKVKKNIKIIDVSEPREYAERSIAGAENIPLGVLQMKLMTGELKLSKENEIVVYCAHGSRSYYAAAMLEHKGYDNVYSLQGGISDFARMG